ncbi:c-type cytochrome [Caballeronia glathei]|uniref:c-type cytochrome n=1 Tax=Caballeronia glathei TaxID=60547 RepID=UPI001E4B88F3|nr:cytochrome c [Caballeronia glathei]
MKAGSSSAALPAGVADPEPGLKFGDGCSIMPGHSTSLRKTLARPVPRWGQRRARTALIALVCLAAATAVRAGTDAVEAGNAAADPAIVSAWRTLRAADCARCHGKDYEGLAAPSIVGFARSQSREMFVTAILDGNPPRGMPAYRDNPHVADRIDDIYRYFAGRANGSIPDGPPSRGK